MGRESLSLDVDVLLYYFSPLPPSTFLLPLSTSFFVFSLFSLLLSHMSDVLVHRVSAIAQLTY